MPASAAGLLEFVHASPSPHHCAAEAARMLQAAGFLAMDESQPFETLEPGHKGFVVRGGALIAWILGDDAPERAGFNLVGAHTDSCASSPTPSLPARAGASGALRSTAGPCCTPGLTATSASPVRWPTALKAAGSPRRCFG